MHDIWCTHNLFPIYAIQHPGGAEILLDVVGKVFKIIILVSRLKILICMRIMWIGTDASEVFEEIGQHTTEARELMTKYCVGRLKS